MEKIMLKLENKIFKNLYNDFGWEIDKAIERNDWKQAAVEGRDSRWYNQVTNRAERLMTMLEEV